ncbi:TPA: DUF2726 domain-containing protein [Salmonella enterica subsp. enterica serovar Muenchen]
MIFILFLFFFCALGVVFTFIILTFFCFKENRQQLKSSLLSRRNSLDPSEYSPFTPSSKVRDIDVFDENINTSGYFRKDFLTLRERDFFNRAILAVGIGYFVFPQVRLVDIITPSISRNKNNLLYLSLFRTVSQYSVDFIIVRKIDFHVVCVVELDDSTHDRPDRIKRDLKVNAALESANIFILRSRSPDYLIKVIKSRFF